MSIPAPSTFALIADELEQNEAHCKAAFAAFQASPLDPMVDPAVDVLSVAHRNRAAAFRQHLQVIVVGLRTAAALPLTYDGVPIIPLITPIYAKCEVGDSEMGPTPCAIVSGVICAGPNQYNDGWTISGTGEWEGMEFYWRGMGVDSPWCSTPAAVEAWLKEESNRIDAHCDAMMQDAAMHHVDNPDPG